MKRAVHSISFLIKKNIFLNLLLFISALSLCSCVSKEERIQNERDEKRNKSAFALYKSDSSLRKKQREAIINFINYLSPEQKIAQLFLVNVEGNTSYYSVEKAGDVYSSMKKKSADFSSQKKEPLVPGGCLLFSYNVGKSQTQLRSFIESIGSYCAEYGIVPPYIALDQEGGDVCRLRGITSRLPSESSVATSCSVDEAYRLYYSQACHMKELGITMNLAPVVEALSEKNKTFLGTRSFGKVHDVIVYGSAAVNGYENGGVGAVLKHFPGNSDTDPHTGLPEIYAGTDEVESFFIAPFARLASFSPSGILMSHARVSSVDPRTPACLSKKWVEDIIRNKMNYVGLVVSDDIFMGALNANGFPPEKAAVQAIEAGVDILMFSEKKFADVAAVLLDKASVDSSFSKKIDDAVYKVVCFKISHGIIDLKYQRDGNGNISYSVCFPNSDRSDRKE